MYYLIIISVRKIYKKQGCHFNFFQGGNVFCETIGSECAGALVPCPTCAYVYTCAVFYTYIVVGVHITHEYRAVNIYTRIYTCTRSVNIHKKVKTI